MSAFGYLVEAAIEEQRPYPYSDGSCNGSKGMAIRDEAGRLLLRPACGSIQLAPSGLLSEAKPISGGSSNGGFLV